MDKCKNYSVCFGEHSNAAVHIYGKCAGTDNNR